MRYIYALCPDANHPIGGVRKIYNLVEQLREIGYDAFILHAEWGFKCDWFPSRVPIVYMDPDGSLSGLNEDGESFELPRFEESDLLIIPEIYSYKVVPSLVKWKLKGLIFNQIAFQELRENVSPVQPFSAEHCRNELPLIYCHERVLGVLVVSEYSKVYFEMLNPNLSVFRIRNSINKDIFFYSSEKKKQIAYMPRKNLKDALHVISLIKYRNKLQGWDFYPMDRISEFEVGRIMRESAIFLSFSEMEGFGMPPAEAMACGCLVIGYHGQGGKEYFKQPVGFPIEPEDIVTFVLTLEDVALNYSSYCGKGKIASEYILENYSKEHEKDDIMKAFEELRKVEE